MKLKTYTFEVVVEEGSDEFWESIAGEAGCKEVVEMVRNSLAESGMIHGENCTVNLKRFEA